MALFGRDYERDYGYYNNDRRDLGYRGNMYGSYDRDHGYRGAGAYDRDHYKSRWQTDYGDPFGDRAAHTPMRMIRGRFRGYDRDMRPMGHDRGMRPMGSERGMPAMGYDRGMQAMGYDTDYYASNPMSYDPYDSRNYQGRPGAWNRYDQGYRTGGGSRGYDRGWF